MLISDYIVSTEGILHTKDVAVLTHDIIRGLELFIVSACNEHGVDLSKRCVLIGANESTADSIIESHPDSLYEVFADGKVVARVTNNTVKCEFTGVREVMLPIDASCLFSYFCCDAVKMIKSLKFTSVNSQLTCNMYRMFYMANVDEVDMTGISLVSVSNIEEMFTGCTIKNVDNVRMQIPERYSCYDFIAGSPVKNFVWH